MTTRRALVLSGSIGSGHDTVAAACSAALAADGVASEVLDCMALLGRGGSALASAIFRKLLEVAPAYDAFHFSQLRAGSPLARRLESAAASRLVPALAAETRRSASRLLVAVFATGAGAAGRLRAESADLRAVVVVTDATAHRLWIHPAIDRYVVFSAIAAGTVRQYAPRADVVVLPPAVRDAFLEAPDRDAARTSLGWPNHSTPVVLVMGGGWGRGPLGEIARALLAVGCDVTVLAGSNTTLVRQLGAGPGSGRRPSRAARAPRSEGKLRVLGPSDRVPELMAAADVVVTPPGQACHEARAVGRPLVLLDSVPGHGRENLLLELSKGGAVAARPEPAAVVAALSAVLDGAAVLEPWPCKAPGEWNGRFAEALAGLW